MLTVLCWLWSQPGGRTRFTAHHVGIWADMVRRNLNVPHRLACVTDMPQGIPSHVDIIAPPHEFENIVLPTWKDGRPQCLRRLTMFRPDAAQIFGDRFVCMDLDVVIGGDITDLFDAPEFKICKGTAKNRPYNGSMMLIEAGKRPQVYTEFTPKKAVKAGELFTGSDQAWISYCLGPNEAVWAHADGVAWYDGRIIPDMRMMFFPGQPKPWVAAALGTEPWVVEHYRRAGSGRCLLLGYGETLWSDVERAIEEPFDAVVASPEAAHHWPGEVLAVARMNQHAERIARMHGFDRVDWCGRGTA